MTNLDINIEFCAIANERRGYGFLPAVFVDGERHGNTWQEQGYDHMEAVVRAQLLAHKEAGRWLGDYRVSITSKTRCFECGTAITSCARCVENCGCCAEIGEDFVDAPCCSVCVNKCLALKDPGIHG